MIRFGLFAFEPWARSFCSRTPVLTCDTLEDMRSKKKSPIVEHGPYSKRWVRRHSVSLRDRRASDEVVLLIRAWYYG